MSGMASSGRVLRGSDSSEEDSEIDPISDPSDLATIAASSEPSGRVFIGTPIVEVWGRAEVGWVRGFSPLTCLKLCLYPSQVLLSVAVSELGVESNPPLE